MRYGRVVISVWSLCVFLAWSSRDVSRRDSYTFYRARLNGGGPPPSPRRRDRFFPLFVVVFVVVVVVVVVVVLAHSDDVSPARCGVVGNPKPQAGRALASRCERLFFFFVSQDVLFFFLRGRVVERARARFHFFSASRTEIMLHGNCCLVSAPRVRFSAHVVVSNCADRNKAYTSY